jgi:hydrogenase maturation protease
MMSEVKKKVAVLGFGNVLMSDDGLGPYVLKQLEAEYECGEGVSLVDLGAPGLGLEQYIAGLDVVIIVDTVRASGPPGHLRMYRREEILKYAPGLRLSPHDPGLKEALLSLDFSGCAPHEVFLVGVIPAKVELGVTLSEVVQAVIPLVKAEVIGELSRLGICMTKRTPPQTPDIWWACG